MDEKIKKLIDDTAAILAEHVCANLGDKTEQCKNDVRQLVKIEVLMRIKDDIPLCDAEHLCVEILHEVYEHNCSIDHIIKYMRSMLLK